MKRTIALIASLAALLPVLATTVWNVNGTGGWNSASQWSNGVPGSGNPAKFENVTLTFTDSDVANLNTAKIVPAAGSTLIFDFSNDQEILSDIQLQTMTSKIVKKGAGNLTLTGDSYSFYGEGCVSVESGIVYAPKISAYLENKQYPCIEVKSPGQLVLPGDRRVYVRGLLGDGTITSATAMNSSNFLVVMGDVQTNHYEFAGTIGANIYLKFGDHRSDYRDFCANQLLSCSYAGALTGFDAYHGNIGVRSFGDGSSNPGSLGYGTIFITYGAQYAAEVGFTYEGTTGETSSRDLQFRGQNPGDTTFYMDAGSYGGLEFTGEWKTANLGTNNKMYRLCLRGDNEMPCTFSGKLTPMMSAYDVVLTKQGTGTWNLMCGNKNTLRGPVHVERGTLGYNTVRGINSDCALGRATMLQTNFLDAAEAPAVPYAVKIGNGSNDTAIDGLATLDYLGSTAVNMSVRPVTLDGAGAFKGTSGVPMCWSGFAAAPAGGTLVLDGDASDGGKIAKNLTDGEGVLSVEKRGGGTWTIMGNNTLSGTVRVKAGKLVAIGDNAWYTWFRWTLKNMLGQPSSSNPALQEIALYDTSGVRQNIGLEYLYRDSYYPARAAADLPPSSATYGNTGYYALSGVNRDLDCCFDDSIDSPKNIGWFLSTYPGSGSSKLYPNGTDANAWEIIMHLGSAVPKIAQYDFCGANVFSDVRAPGSWTWEGSHDGQTWDQLVDYTLTLEEGATLGGYKWMGRRLQASGGANFLPGRVLTAEDTGFPMRGYSNETGTSPLGTAAVQVDPGATLTANGAVTISKLVVDATTGAGTLDGVTLNPAGAVDVVGAVLPSQAYDFKIGSTNGTDLAALANWALTVNGDRTRCKLECRGAGWFRLLPAGFTMVVR